MSAPAIHVLNGPNLDLLGLREPHIYGHTTLAQIEEMCRAAARGPLSFAQTNHEGEMIEMIHAARDSAAGIIINPAGWSFTSIAIRDALAAFDGNILRAATALEISPSTIYRKRQAWAAEGLI